MKNILIIVAHPSQKSFNYLLFQEIVYFCRSNRFQFKTIDLYREDFDPIIRENESQINTKMIENYQSMIVDSDVIILISPIWWARCTTMLEGFFDKIFLEGFAFDSSKSVFLKPLLNDKKVFCFLSFGSTHWLRQLLQKIITYLRLKFSVLSSFFHGNTFIYFCDVSKSKKNDIVVEKDKAIYKLRKKL